MFSGEIVIISFVWDVKLQGAGTMCISVTLYEIAEFYLVVSGEFCNFAPM